METVRNRSAAYYWLPVLLWMALIFFLSHQDKDESRRTSELVLWVLNFLNLDIETLRASYAPLIIRKLAHMTEYAILAILSFRAFNYSVSIPEIRILVWNFCVAYAMTDEFHQTFVSGRGGSIVDVGIDAIGALIGIGLIFFYQRFTYKPLAFNSGS